MKPNQMQSVVKKKTNTNKAMNASMCSTYVYTYLYLWAQITMKEHVTNTK